MPFKYGNIEILRCKAIRGKLKRCNSNPNMATRIDPPSLRTKGYELYRHELLAWREVTDLWKDKQVVAIALSLPEDDKTQIREKVFEQISLDDLKIEDGPDTLITFSDSHIKKVTLRTARRNLRNLRTFIDNLR